MILNDNDMFQLSTDTPATTSRVVYLATPPGMANSKGIGSYKGNEIFAVATGAIAGGSITLQTADEDTGPWESAQTWQLPSAGVAAGETVFSGILPKNVRACLRLELSAAMPIIAGICETGNNPYPVQ